MKKINLTIDPAILNKYPELIIGYMVVNNLHHVSSYDISDDVKQIAKRGINDFGLNLQNLVDHPTISAWRKVYQDCGVKPKTYKSSIESLLRRFIQNDYTPIHKAVDLYNYLSAGYIIPAGAYNIDQIDGGLTLRYANDNEGFTPLSGRQDIPISGNHIVYADQDPKEPIICWQWNHKDSKRTMLTPETDKALFIFDCINPEDVDRLNDLICSFRLQLINAGVEILKSGLLNSTNPQAEINHN